MKRFLIIFAVWGTFSAGPGIAEAVTERLQPKIDTSVETPTESFIEDLKKGQIGTPETYTDHSGHSCALTVNRTRFPDVASTRCKASYVRTWILCRDNVGNRGVFKDPTRNPAGTYSNVSCTFGLPFEVDAWYETSH